MKSTWLPQIKHQNDLVKLSHFQFWESLFEVGFYRVCLPNTTADVKKLGSQLPVSIWFSDGYRPLPSQTVMWWKLKTPIPVSTTREGATCRNFTCLCEIVSHVNEIWKANDGVWWQLSHKHHSASIGCRSTKRWCPFLEHGQCSGLICEKSWHLTWI